MDNRDLGKRFDEVFQKMDRAYERYARSCGMNYSSLALLQLIWERQPCTQKELCALTMLPKQTINNLIRALQEKGYLTLAPNASNRQERILTLTESGLRYAESILLPLLALEESAICAMGAEAVRQMVDMALRYGAILEKAMREASYGKA